MKNKILKAAGLTLAFTLASCGGGGGSHSSGGSVYYSHSQLADEFVLRMYTDLGIDLSLVKVDTLQYDHIVVEDIDLYDPILGPYYTAYDIGSYNPGESLANYIIDYDDDFSYPLTDNYDGTFSGYDGFGNFATFDETSENVKDVQKIQAAVEDIKVNKIAAKLASDFGLSDERSIKVAKIASNWKKQSAKRAMTDADANAFSKEVLGVSMNSVKKAMKDVAQGDSKSLDSLLEEAAQTNGMSDSPEDMKDLLSEYFIN